MNDQDQDDVLRVIREMKAIGGKAKPTSGQIATRLPWGIDYGSHLKLNDALQALRKAGKIRYMKGIGWIEVE